MAVGLANTARPVFVFETFARTETGAVRSLNEDALLVREDIGLWAVADGMGGHDRGEVASAAIISALSGIQPSSHGHGSLRRVTAALQAANRDLRSLCAAGPDPRAVIGATVAVLLIHDGHYACLWAGDSRVYLLRGGRLTRLTRDHSAVQEFVDAGMMTEDQARADSRSKIVTRAIGASPRLELEQVSGRVKSGDVFLVCSDGVSGMLTDEQIARAFSGKPLKLTGDELVDAVFAEGAHDNISAILIKATAPKWIESTRYVGFERRARRSLRLINRRVRPLEPTEPPSTQAIIRQLRAHCLGLSESDRRDRFLVRLEGAIGLAAAHGDMLCAEILSRLREHLLGALTPGAICNVVDVSLNQAHRVSLGQEALAG